ncbi:HAD-IIIA family hydrolase [Priestia aryabhattai]|uniref:HAD-IIIA family hydrolase n=1 Tax=Priestia aryabhattai TaxID=412384 RepID=UPI002040B80C|nr:HAD-IIIA family hydrolase [Priestia aryabhattai]MCM3770504.1 HAD-IIIA family hydrolase [Priestia aryabhattai]
MIEAIFLDRDGTIGGSNKIEYPGDFQLFPQAKQAIREIKKQNIPLFSFTNQPDIAKGKVKKSQFISELLAFGFDDVYLCPHEDSDGCSCRKPKPDMLLKAAAEHSLNLANCILIGDHWKDLVAASAAGAQCILVLTGAGHDTLNEREKWADVQTAFIASNIQEAVEFIFTSLIPQPILPHSHTR